jgi:uncharacterized protein YjiS (DUF1127 family)
MTQGMHTGTPFGVTDAELGEVIGLIKERKPQRIEPRVASALGEIMVVRLFGGSLDLWRRKAMKVNALRRMADLPGCPLRANQLNDLVRVYAACEREPRILRLPLIRTSHVTAVLVLDETEQLPMLERSSQHEWTVRHLRKEVAAYRRERCGERRGAPKATPGKRLTTRARRCIRELEALKAELGQLNDIGLHETITIAHALDHLTQNAREVRETLTRAAEVALPALFSEPPDTPAAPISSVRAAPTPSDADKSATGS